MSTGKSACATPRYTSPGPHRWKSRRAGVRALRYQSEAYFTVNLAVPLTLPSVAVMVTVPAAMARPIP